MPNLYNREVLIQALKTKKKVSKFSDQSGLNIDYLTVLRSALNGYKPNPNRIKDLPNVSEEITVKLKAIGIKNTLHLYLEVLSKETIRKLATKSELSGAVILMLTKLTALSRVK